MMGSQGAGQAPLFYAFNLEDHIPGDHLLRGIDRFMDLRELRQHLAAFYSHTGRPSIDPELMIRMLVIGYCFGIRSERRLCEEVHLNLAYRWFCRLGLEDRIPDHSTFSKNRHGRFRQSDAFRHVFESVLRTLHGRGPGWWRRLCHRRQRDQGRCEPRQRRAGQPSAQLEPRRRAQPSPM
jgi:transposase